MKPHKSSHALHASENPTVPLPLSAPVRELENGVAGLGESVRKLQQESARFVTERFEGNMRTLEAFGTCRSLPDLFAVQQKWFADTARAYSEEWSRCAALMSQTQHVRAGSESNDEPAAPSQ